jgi:ubiquinone/menaquinone biosynthesis C-methylase UbiE
MPQKIKGFSDTIAWYEANAVFYAQSIQDKPDLEMIRTFAKRVHERDLGKRVLDAGCAAGRDSELLSEQNLEVTGIDLSKNLIAIAREKNPHLDFVVGSFLDLPFVDNVFAGIWAHASLLHLEKIEEVSQALAEFKRTLVPGGVLHLSLKQRAGEEEISVVVDSISKHERFFRWFTKEEVKSLLVEQDYKILEITDNLPDTAGRSEVKWISCLAQKPL